MKHKTLLKIFLLMLVLLFLLTGCQTTGPKTVWCLTERKTLTDGEEIPYIVQIRYGADGTPLECLAGPEEELVQVGLRTYDENGNLLFYKNTYFDREETYDVRGNILEKKLNGNTYRYTYDDENRMISEELLNQDGKQQSLINYEYDEKGNLTREASGWDGRVHSEIRYTYDTQGNCLSKTHYDEEGKVSDLVVSSKYEYDSKGNLLREKSYLGGEPYGSTYIYTYDEKGNRISFLQDNHDGSAFEARYTFNEAGQETSFTDITRETDGTEYIRYFYYTYDEWGHKTGQHDIDHRGKERKFLWIYDKNGNLLTEVCDGEVSDYSIVWTYDKEGRPLTYTSEGLWDFASQQIWEYDGHGNLIRETIKRNNRTTVVTYSYTSMTLPADQAEEQRDAQKALIEALNTSYMFAD